MHGREWEGRVSHSREQPFRRVSHSREHPFIVDKQFLEQDVVPIRSGDRFTKSTFRHFQQASSNPSRPWQPGEYSCPHSSTTTWNRRPPICEQVEKLFVATNFDTPCGVVESHFPLSVPARPQKFVSVLQTRVGHADLVETPG